jgi:hypothetical protein
MSLILIKILGKDITSIVRKYLLPLQNKISNLEFDIPKQSYYLWTKKTYGNYVQIWSRWSNQVEFYFDCHERRMNYKFLRENFKSNFVHTIYNNRLYVFIKLKNLTYSDVLRSDNKELINEWKRLRKTDL